MSMGDPPAEVALLCQRPKLLERTKRRAIERETKERARLTARM
jgi:hypothetical protein